MPIYIVTSTFVSVVIAWQTTERRSQAWLRYTILSLIILYWVTALLSVIYACIELNKKGISSEVRSLILKRHCLTIIFFICASSYVLFGSVIVLHFSDQKQEEYNNWYVLVLKLLFQS